MDYLLRLCETSVIIQWRYIPKLYLPSSKRYYIAAMTPNEKNKWLDTEELEADQSRLFHT